jgi:hypothetical protein
LLFILLKDTNKIIDITRCRGLRHCKTKRNIAKLDDIYRKRAIRCFVLSSWFFSFVFSFYWLIFIHQVKRNDCVALNESFQFIYLSEAMKFYGCLNERIASHIMQCHHWLFLRWFIQTYPFWAHASSQQFKSFRGFSFSNNYDG